MRFAPSPRGVLEPKDALCMQTRLNCQRTVERKAPSLMLLTNAFESRQVSQKISSAISAPNFSSVRNNAVKRFQVHKKM